MRKTIALSLAALMLLLTAGCGSFDVTRLLERESQDRVPEIAAAPTARASAGFTGPASKVRLDLGDGVVCVVEDMGVANELLWSTRDDSYLMAEPPACEYSHPVEILDDKDTVLARVDVADDGSRAAVRADEQVMMIPEYVYYTLEYDLWTCGRSFSGRTVKYEPDTDSDAVLEMSFDRQLPVLLCRRYGYADGYFTQWKLYRVEKTSDTVTAYAMVSYALYALSEETFEPVRKGHVAVKLTYDWLSDGVWQLGAAKISDDSVEERQIQTAVRAVFPFEDTQTYMKDLKDTSTLDAGIISLAREYLRLRGLGRLTLDS